MREPYSEDLANHAGPESCGHDREVVVEALTGVRTGRVLSRESCLVRGADAVSISGRQYPERRHGKATRTFARSETLCMYGNTSRENREISFPPDNGWRCGARREASGLKPTMYGHEKSDRCVVPTKLPNNGGRRTGGRYGNP